MLLNIVLLFLTIPCFYFLHPFLLIHHYYFINTSIVTNTTTKCFFFLKMEFIWKFPRRLYTCGVRGFSVLSILLQIKSLGYQNLMNTMLSGFCLKYPYIYILIYIYLYKMCCIPSDFPHYSFSHSIHPFGCSSFCWPYMATAAAAYIRKFTCISHLFLLLVVNWKENLIE